MPAEFTQIFGNYIFPVAMCMAMMWYVYDRENKEREDRINVQNQHKAEVDNLANIINNNTLAITRLADHLENK